MTRVWRRRNVGIGCKYLFRVDVPGFLNSSFGTFGYGSDPCPIEQLSVSSELHRSKGRKIRARGKTDTKGRGAEFFGPLGQCREETCQIPRCLRMRMCSDHRKRGPLGRAIACTQAEAPKARSVSWRLQWHTAHCRREIALAAHSRRR